MRRSVGFAMIRNGFAFSVLLFCTAASASAEKLKTPGEENGFTRYTQSLDIARFLSRLSAQSENLVVQAVGRTLPRDEFPSQDILLCVITREGVAFPSDLDRTKPTLLLTASKHGNEQSAKEAALELIRDICVGDLRGLLDKCNFLFMPQVNPYGNFFNRREDENGLDMNRDHIKLETEGVRAVVRVFRAWMPEITVDVHERGDNFHRVAIGCVSNPNIDFRIQEYSRKQILPYVEKALSGQGVTFHEYLVEEEMGLNTAAGAALSAEETEGREMMRRYSTSDINDGRNGPGMYQTLSFIQEISSRHDLKTLAERTRWQTAGLRALVNVMADRNGEILAMVRALRADLAERTRIYSKNNRVVLKSEYASDQAEPVLTVQEFQEADSLAAGIMKKDRKAGEVLLESDVAEYPYPADQRVVTRVIRNWFPRVVPALEKDMPLGYVVPAAYGNVAEILLDHGIDVSVFDRDEKVTVETYEVTGVKPSKHDYLPPDSIDVTVQKTRILAKSGDFYVSCAQPASRLIVCLLEPQSDYGMIRYWKYKLVPEKGNFFALYRVVEDQAMPLVPYRPWRK